MLGISQNRVYVHIRANRLPAQKVGKAYLILKSDIENFEPNPRGRARSNPAPWRAYQEASLLATEIDVQVRAGQQERLTEKLRAMLRDQQHIFPGSIARYVWQQGEQAGSVRVQLIWKSTDMPDEQKRQSELAAFQEQLADVLDWQTAKVREVRALIHT